MTNTAKAKRSTVNGVEQELESPSGGRVPSYVAARGVSVDEAADSLGLRIPGRRDVTPDLVYAAEIHDAGGQSYWAVRK